MLRLPRLLVMAWILGAACIAAGSAQAQGDEGDLREVIDLMTAWRFHLGDPAGAEQPGFDDGDWRTLDLPHDWAFEGGVSKDGAQRGGGGYFSAGVGWYRHTLVSPPLEDDQQLTIEFDGVYMNSEVWINGHRLGRFPYGYLSVQLRPDAPSSAGRKRAGGALRQHQGTLDPLVPPLRDLRAGAGW